MPSAPAPAPAAPSGPRGEWRALPALAETIGEPPLIAPPRPFKQALAVNQAPPPALAPLGHQRSLGAPSGLLLGVARPVPATGGGQEALRLHRPATMAQAWSDEAPPAGADADSHLSPAAPDTLGPTSSPPARRLRAADGPPTAQHRALARLEPADLALLPAAAPAGTLRQVPPRGQRSVHTVVAPSVVAPPAAAPPEPVQPTAGGRQSAPSSSGVSQLTLGQSRRLGLGAPLPALPPSAVQRAPQAPEPGRPMEMPLATHQPSRAAPSAENSGAAPLAPADLAPAPAPPPSEAAGRTSALLVPAPARLAPAGLPVLRLATPAPSVAPSQPHRRRQDSPPSSATTPTASRARAARSVAPLLASRPLRSRVQRAPSAGTGDQASAAGLPLGGGVADGPVRVHRGGEASQAASAFQARAFTHGGEVFLPARHGPLNSGTARSLLAHELVHVAQQRSLGGELPAEDSPHGHALEAQARAAEMGETPLVLAAATRAGRETETATGDGVMRSPQPEAFDGQAQDEPQSTGTTETAVVQLSTIQRAAEAPSAAAPAPSAAGTTRSEQELEELARQLYGRIHLRLRRELMVDRERAGLVFDGR
ncbi:MAG TPA: DUF4157 domain-containing protein [Candidatus Limnocylindria bacterium]|nr:DUF4157 domain-containing protein [Candidatus Limnocylindria bacterium]